MARLIDRRPSYKRSLRYCCRSAFFKSQSVLGQNEAAGHQGIISFPNKQYARVSRAEIVSKFTG